MDGLTKTGSALFNYHQKGDEGFEKHLRDTCPKCKQWPDNEKKHCDYCQRYQGGDDKMPAGRGIMQPTGRKIFQKNPGFYLTRA